MFSWGSKGQPSLSEKLSSTTKQARTILSEKLMQTYKAADDAIVKHLIEHASVHSEPICTLNFDKDFDTKIAGFAVLSQQEKSKVISHVTDTLKKDEGLTLSGSGNVLTVRWKVNDDAPKPAAPTVDKK